MRATRFISKDDGFALATVLAAIALITVIALGGYVIAENTLVEAQRVGTENRAYQAASSALEQELSVFTREDLLLGQSKSGYAYGTQQSINGTDWFVVTVNDSNDDASLGPDEFEMIALGGSESATETVRVRFQNFNLWDMNISGSENSNMGSGAGFNGNGTIIGKVYSNGDFEWSGSGQLDIGPVFVRNGTFIKQSSGSSVGEATDPIATYFDNPPTGPGVDSNFYAEQKGSAPKLQIPFPTADDMDNWRTWAINDSAANKMGNAGAWDPTYNPGGVPRHPSAASDANYNVFNGDVTIGGSNFGKLGGVAKLGDGSIDEAASGDILAVSGSTLYINGLTYVDGTLTIDNSIQQYIGKGLLVAKNGVVINGRLVPAAFNSGSWEVYEGTPMPLITTNDCIGFATLGNVTQNSADWVAGAVFATGTYSATASQAKFRGSIIANGIDFQQPNCWLVTQTGMSANLPPGMPDLPNMNARSDWIRR